MMWCVNSHAGSRHVRAFSLLVVLTVSIVAVVMCGVSACLATPPVAVKADRVFVGDGRVVENGTVLIQDGRIRAVGPKIRVPKDATVLELENGCITPGLIDANARIESAGLLGATSIRIVYGDGTTPEEETGGTDTDAHADAGDDSESVQQQESIDVQPSHVDSEEELPPLISGVRSTVIINEQSSEVVPHIHVIDALDLRSRNFDRLVRGGVTTVYASPDASAVIGARGAIVHTAGPRASRVLVPAAAVKATIGSEPSSLGTYNRSPSRYSTSMYARRPNSRMGLVWVFRKAFYDAVRLRDGLDVYGADTAEPEALDVILDIRERKVPLRIQARIQRDILAALRLAEEFDLEFTLEEATEAYLTIDELKAASVPVIFGPIYERPSGIRVRSGEGNESRYFTFRALLEAKIPTALSAQDLREEDGLARQAMYAQRFGVSFDDALRSVTQTPARMLGLDKDLGTLDRGKRADLVVWSGTPFAATSMPQVVLIDGEVVLDRR